MAFSTGVLVLLTYCCLLSRAVQEDPNPRNEIEIGEKTISKTNSLWTDCSKSLNICCCILTESVFFQALINDKAINNDFCLTLISTSKHIKYTILMYHSYDYLGHTIGRSSDPMTIYSVSIAPTPLRRGQEVYAAMTAKLGELNKHYFHSYSNLLFSLKVKMLIAEDCLWYYDMLI